MRLREGTTGQVSHLACWLLLAPLAAGTAARLVAWDASSSLVAFNAVAAFAILPALGCALLGLALRRAAVVCVASVVVAVLATVSWQERAATAALPASARAAPSIVVFDAEVKAGRRHPADYAREIIRAGADVVTLQQAPPAFVADLRALVGPDRLAHVTRFTGHGRLGGLEQSSLVVLSRFPITDARVVDRFDRPTFLTAVVQVPGHPLRVIDAHTIAPIGGDREQWLGDLGAIRGEARRARGPTLVIGDLNATFGHQGLRSLLSAGLVDAAAARGHPDQFTWPNDAPVPPFLRVDHVLTAGPLVATRIRLGTGRGSDHRPLVATLAFLPG